MPFRCLIIAGFIFFSGGFAIAQPQKNDVYIRTNLLSLIDPFAAGPTIGAEYFLTDHVSLGTDVGIILYNLQRQKSDNMGKPYGYKIKPEIRYYLYKKSTKKRLRLFISLEGLFLNISNTNYNSLPIFDNTGIFVYNYLGGYEEVKKVRGAVTKCGMQIPQFIFKNMLFEVYAGVGIRDKRFSYKNLPAGASAENRFSRGDFFDLNTDGPYPSLSAGFKLVFKIR